MTVPDILMKVLSGLNVDVANRIQGEFARSDYCAQYRESTSAFASRLMEDEGIFYFFEHTANGHQMVLADIPLGPHRGGGPSRVAYEQVMSGNRNDERVTDWKKSQETRQRGRYTLVGLPLRDARQAAPVDLKTVASSTAGPSTTRSRWGQRPTRGL